MGRSETTSSDPHRTRSPEHHRGGEEHRPTQRGLADEARPRQAREGRSNGVGDGGSEIDQDARAGAGTSTGGVVGTVFGGDGGVGGGKAVWPKRVWHGQW